MDKRIKTRLILDIVSKRQINWYNIYRMKMYDAGYKPPGKGNIWIR